MPVFRAVRIRERLHLHVLELLERVGVILGSFLSGRHVWILGRSIDDLADVILISVISITSCPVPLPTRLYHPDPVL